MNKVKRITKANRYKFKPIVTFFIIIFMLSSVFVTANTSDNLVIQPTTQEGYSFEMNDESIRLTIAVGSYEMTNTDGGDEIFIEDFGRLLVPGKPNLPSKIFSIAIPPGATVESVTFDSGEGIQIPGNYEISPSSLPRVVGKEDPKIYAQDLKKYENNYNQVYQNDEFYPSCVGEFVRTSGYRKYNLVDVRINPISYNPVSGCLKYYPDITVNIEYSVADDFTDDDIIIDYLERTEESAETIIINYQEATGWYTKQIQRSVNDFVIITLDSLTSSVEPIVNWEEAKGKTVEVVTTSWIESNYGGYDLAEKMRNFLIEKYPSSEWGIENVLLVGDYDDVPMRRCWQDAGYGKPETDFYYAELSLPDDQSWDSDGDHRYGEDSDSIDFYAEVNVGRIPWSDPDTVLHICQKSVAYENNDDPSYKKNILLLAAFFWPDTDNAVLMETKVDQPWMEDWTMTRMYEQVQTSYPTDYNLNYNNVKTVWSDESFAFVNWAGHGSPDACFEYYPSQAFVDVDTCNYLNDDYPAIIFADACSNSDTDDYNIGKAMLKQGGVGFLGATKVAYGMGAWSNPYSGSSQSLDYFFTTCVTSGEYTQGEAHQWGLIEMYTNGLWYYDRYETFEWGALWGNPDLGMGQAGSNSPPLTPETPEGPEEGETGIEYLFTTSTDDPESNDVYYMWNWGNEVSQWLGPFTSGETVQIPHVWSTPGNFTIKVKAKDEHGKESGWSEPISISIEAIALIDIGEITGGFGVTAEIKNIGALAADNVEWTILLEGIVLMGGENSGTFEKIMPGFGPTAETGFMLGLGPVKITVTADEAEKTASGFMIGPFIINVN